MFAARLKNNPVLASLTTAAVLAVVSFLWTTGGFVTVSAYAEDQGKLDHIIDLIQTTDSMQTSARRHAALDATVANAEQRIDELQLYIGADPDSPLNAARMANIRRLGLIIAEAKRDKAELIRQERS